MFVYMYCFIFVFMYFFINIYYTIHLIYVFRINATVYLEQILLKTQNNKW